MATITLLKTGTPGLPDHVARPRLVLGLDPFGTEVLNGAPLPPGVVVEPTAHMWDEVDLLLDRTLSGSAWSDAQAIEPVIMAVADLGGDAAGEIGAGLGAAMARALRDQIALSAILVMRLLERGPERADPARVTDQVRGLVTSLLAYGQPGHGRVTVTVLSNRDGAGRVCQPDECAEMARQLVALLADPGAGDDPRLRRVLTPLPPSMREADDPWGETAAFAAVSLLRVVYPTTDAAIARTRAALGWLEPMLNAHPAASWEPRIPTLGDADLEMETRFGQARLPVWEPDPWRPLDAEIARAHAVVRSWSADAREWDQEQGARVAARCLALADEGEKVLAAWRGEVRTDLASVLGDQALPGLWQSLRRWRAAAVDTLPVPPVPPAVPEAPGDPTVLETRVLAAVGRRTNVRAVFCVALVTLLTGSSLILMASDLGAVSPHIAMAWRAATLALGLPGTGSVWALGVLGVSAVLFGWRLILGARMGSERAWKQDVHIPARKWTLDSAAYHRATLRTKAAQVQADLVERATSDMRALDERIDALQAAFEVTSAVSVDDGAGPKPGERFTRRLTPTPPSLPPGDASAAAHAVRTHPALLAWFVNGTAQDAAAMRDQVLQDVTLAGDASFASDPAALAAAAALLPTATGDPRRAVSLKTRLLAMPRWSVAEFLAVPPTAANDPALLANGAVLLPGAADQIVALTLVTGLTAADLFGAADALAQMTLTEEHA